MLSLKSIIISAAAAFLLSCTSQNVVEQFPYGTYSYTSYDFIGQIIGEGQFIIVKSDSSKIEGSWNIRSVKGCLNCGPQFGTGFLTGNFKSDSLVIINLNPNDIYNSTELYGKVSNNLIDGEWRWLSDVGIVNTGRFIARKL